MGESIDVRERVLDVFRGVQLREGVTIEPVVTLILSWCARFYDLGGVSVKELDSIPPEIERLESVVTAGERDGEQRLTKLRALAECAEWTLDDLIHSYTVILAAIVRASTREKQSWQEDMVSRLLRVGAPRGQSGPAPEKRGGRVGSAQQDVHQRIARAGGWRYVDLVSVPALAISQALRRPPASYRMYPVHLSAQVVSPISASSKLRVHHLMLADDAPRDMAVQEPRDPEDAEDLLRSYYPWRRPRRAPGPAGYSMILIPAYGELILYADPRGRTLRGARPPVLTFVAPL